MSVVSLDRIEKRILIRAPRSRVWRALTDTKEFGSWFGVELTGQFVSGQRLKGKVTHKGYEHLTWDVMVVTVEPERMLSWRWHPNAIDASKDYASELTTLVVFELEDAEAGTILTLVESGFEGVPAERREEAFRGNDGGWAVQMESVKRHVESTP